ncbi:hypothetical protein H6G33_09345 [Calothrix sp. FACHB-1219]|uniref:hypothetical protein n=1 Tax=unclassified Calothrix TaxID=2619626 RepID=UPI001687BD43|nr:MULTISPECIES: hypothetical protein [unclassified Calothrix]MBD2201550.1 hypothetical protein [Calothrix sp. FACHB-168]MBD2217236.1 hypothetical protein [Calothrix sp. FACHB-1219]
MDYLSSSKTTLDPCCWFPAKLEYFIDNKWEQVGHFTDVSINYLDREFEIERGIVNQTKINLQRPKRLIIENDYKPFYFLLLEVQLPSIELISMPGNRKGILSLKGTYRSKRIIPF